MPQYKLSPEMALIREAVQPATRRRLRQLSRSDAGSSSEAHGAAGALDQDDVIKVERVPSVLSGLETLGVRTGRSGRSHSRDYLQHKGHHKGTRSLQNSDESISADVSGVDDYTTQEGTGPAASSDNRNLYGMNVFIVEGLPDEIVRSTVILEWMASLISELERNAGYSNDNVEDPCRPVVEESALYNSFSPRLVAFFCAEVGIAGML